MQTSLIGDEDMGHVHELKLEMGGSSNIWNTILVDKDDTG
jgi:hypothetical protein